MMEGSSDAKRIGVELQNLLKIPPISKVDNVRGSTQGMHIFCFRDLVWIVELGTCKLFAIKFLF